MVNNTLFDLLDINHDNNLSRSELLLAAKRLGWHWYEAPLLALLDLMTIREPITRTQFTAIIQQIQNDPLGPYGDVLLKLPHFDKNSSPAIDQPRSRRSKRAGKVSNRKLRPHLDDQWEKDLVAAIEKTAGQEIAAGYQRFLDAFDTFQISGGNAALLIIDPQRSFTGGVWKRSMGEDAAIDVKPIAIAFANCAQVLNTVYGRIETMFTRCPFPPVSYEWDDRLNDILDSRQLYFIKPGNSVLFPPLNGFREWLTRCMAREINTLVLGGCTLNSCVRVSAIETLNYFKEGNLKLVVDLSLCGARLRNFSPSANYGGMSAVASAVRQMTAAGVQVVRRVEWDLDLE